MLAVWLTVIVGFFALAATSSRTTTPVPETLSYSTFLSEVAANDVKSVQIN